MSERLSQTMTLVQEGMTGGLHIGAQLCVMIDGALVAEEAVGLARLGKDSPGGVDVGMTKETLMLWLSAGKPVTAIAVMMLWERAVIGLDETVGHYWPEFGSNGKEGITIRHLLTHTAGIRGVDTSYPFATWEETVSKIAGMKMEGLGGGDEGGVSHAYLVVCAGGSDSAGDGDAGGTVGSGEPVCAGGDEGDVDGDAGGAVPGLWGADGVFV